MKVAVKIQEKIEAMSPDIPFKYADLDIPKENYQTAAKALERLQTKGIIRKISKGVFFKPRQTVFGELRPSDMELLKPYLFENGKRVAYITGTALYNQMGLTTQMAFQIKIASWGKRIYVNTGAIKASPVKSYAEVNNDNYRYLILLDALKDLKRIPDSNMKRSIDVISGLIMLLEKSSIKELIEYALLYPPRARALVGAILEQLDKRQEIAILRESLNPLSQFKLGIKPTVLPAAPTWNIV
jgi:hypothetical protein